MWNICPGEAAKHHLSVSVSWQENGQSVCRRINELLSWCQDRTWEGRNVSARGNQQTERKRGVWIKEEEEEGDVCILQHHSRVACFVQTVVARMGQRLRWKALWWFFIGRTGMSSRPEQFTLFSLLVFPDLINRLLRLCSDSEGCTFSFLFWWSYVPPALSPESWSSFSRFHFSFCLQLYIYMLHITRVTVALLVTELLNWSSWG